MNTDIVVGIDGSEHSMRALRWAAAEARARGSALRIVNAWQAPAFAEMAGPEIITAMEDSALQLITAAAEDPALEGVTVQRDVAYGSAARALCGSKGIGSAAARLTVRNTAQ